MFKHFATKNTGENVGEMPHSSLNSNDHSYPHLVVVNEESSLSTTHDAETFDNVNGLCNNPRKEFIPRAVAVEITDQKIKSEKKQPFGAQDKRNIGVWVRDKVFPHMKFTDEDHVRSLTRNKVAQIVKENTLSVDEGNSIFLNVRMCISDQLSQRRSYAHRQLKDKLFCKFMNFVQRNQLFVVILF